MSKLVGYARVSTLEQDVQLQLSALELAGCEKNNIFIDKISGAKTERPGLNKCIEALESGDILIVWRLDRLGRSLIHLIALIDELNKKGVGFKSICDGVIDTTTASGELIFNVFSCMAQFERRLIQERTNAGLKEARARGRLGGRPKIIPNPTTVATAKYMHKDKKITIATICETLNLSRSKLYRYLSLKE